MWACIEAHEVGIFHSPDGSNSQALLVVVPAMFYGHQDELFGLTVVNKKREMIKPD